MFGLNGTEAGAAHPFIQHAADGEHRIADRLGLEPPRRKSPQQPRCGIDLQSVGVAEPRIVDRWPRSESGDARA